MSLRWMTGAADDREVDVCEIGGHTPTTWGQWQKTGAELEGGRRFETDEAKSEYARKGG